MLNEVLRYLSWILVAVAVQACGGEGGTPSEPGPTSPQPAALPGSLSISGTGQASAGTALRWQSSLGSGQTGLTLEWTFGDGSGSTAIEPVHSYAEAGRYEVNLTVRNSTWQSVSTRRTVEVAGPAKHRSCTGPGLSGWCWQLPNMAGPGPLPATRLQFFDAQRGWLAAPDRVAQTADGGRTWTPQSPANLDPARTQMADERHGWQLGAQAEVTYTSDGGNSWTAASALPVTMPRRLWPLGGARALVTGRGVNTSGLSISYVTSDGGQTWLSTDMNVVFISRPRDGQLTFHGFREGPWPRAWGRWTDPGRGFIEQTSVARDKLLLSIGDAGQGQLWATVSDFLPFGSEPPYVLAPQLLRSSDDGQTWQALALPETVAVGTLVMGHNGIGLARELGRPESKILLRTTDGGSTWTLWATPAGLTEDRIDRIVYDREQVWVRITGGTWLVSRDFGVSWLPVPALAPDQEPIVAAYELEPDPESLAYPSVGALVMRGTGSDPWTVSTFVSSSQGQTWTTLPGSGQQASFSELWFFDRLRGIAVGNSHIFETDDGGLSWTPSPIRYEVVGARGLHFTADGTGWMTYGSSLVRSTDRGRTWVRYTTAFEEARMLTASFGWTFGRIAESCGIRPPCERGPYGVFTTQDGGFSWVRRSPEASPPDIHASFATPELGFRLDSNGALLRSADGGQTWVTPAGHGLPSPPWAGGRFLFINAREGWILEGLRTWRTLDGGLTWAAGTPVQGAQVWESLTMRFADANHGWLAGSKGTVWGTENGGQTWALQTTGLTSGYSALFALDAQHVWVGGAAGAVLATTTGGR